MRELALIRRILIAATSVCLQLSAIAVAAQDASDASDQGDPPDRVARLSYLKGGVSFESEDEPGWVAGSLNRPMTTGDSLRLERNARAELQTGPLDIQLDEQSEFSFLELTDDVAQIRLTDGAIYLSLRRIRDDEVVEVDTPHAAIAITKPGEYAISISPNGGRTLVRTYSGECEVTDDRETLKLGSREQAAFEGAGQSGRPAIESIGPRNAFESWAHDRAVRGERSVSSRYVGPDVIGYSDLDEYGDWISESEYGYVWVPRHVAVGWSPYRYGRWTWVSPWGWTWVDDAPWGFAPFHYGRWASIRSRWVWVPGPLHVRPVYAPALVAWVGSAPPRSSVSFSVTFGNGIGWFPLAPREIFVPSYHCSRRHIYNVNYANTVVVNNVYINRAYNDRHTYMNHVNRRIDGAVTVVRPEAFSGSRHTREHLVRVDHRDLRNWQTRNSIADVQPVRERNSSWRDGAQSGGGGRGPQREVVMRRTPQTSAAHTAVARQNAPDTRDSMNRAPVREPNRGGGVRETMNRDGNRGADVRERGVERGPRPFNGGSAEPERQTIDNSSSIRRQSDRQERQVERPVERTREPREIRNEERSRGFERMQPRGNDDAGARQQRYEVRQERSPPPQMRESRQESPRQEYRQESRQESRPEPRQEQPRQEQPRHEQRSEPRQERHDGERGNRERFR